MAKLLLEGRPVGEVDLMVQEPCLGNAREIKRYSAELVRVVPVISCAYPLVVIEPVLHIFAAETSEDRRVTLVVYDVKRRGLRRSDGLRRRDGSRKGIHPLTLRHVGGLRVQAAA